MLRRSGYLLTVALLSLIPAANLQAVPMSEQQVTVAVETWLQKVLTENRVDARAVRLDSHVVDGQVVAYIAHLAGGGFCLCGADDILLPVYLYAPKGDYDPDNPGLQDILAEIAGRFAFVQEGQATGDPQLDEYRDVLSDRADFWRNLTAGQVPARIQANKNSDFETLMKLPLNSAWKQGDPYNVDCPTMPGETPSKVGCVATAMAQIMYYWHWPPTGTSSRNTVFEYFDSATWLSEPLSFDPGITDSFWSTRLRWVADDGGQLQMAGSWDWSTYNSAYNILENSPYRVAMNDLFARLDHHTQNHYANFGTTTYDFDQMQDEHTPPYGTDDEEVAKLSYHAGIAIGMDWGIKVSLASTSFAGSTLTTYFRYAPGTVYGTMDVDTMVDEIQWLRPLQVRGSNLDGGHSWVVAGYDLADADNPSFWMNMGWGDWAINWYTLDQVPRNFIYYHNNVTRIAPAGVVRFIGDEGSPTGDGSPGSPYNSLSAALIETPDHGTIIFKAGTDHDWAPGGVIDRPVTIKGEGVTISGQ
jgi:hypothetical protein